VFVTDAGNREVLEYDGSSGAILRWYAYGLGSNDVLSQMNVGAATRATLVPDILGSVIATQASTTGALSKIGYLPYGKSASAGPFGFTGQRIDAETNGLYYYRARQYSPAWGRFLQADPIGYGGGSNLYAYVNNDPLNNVDPLGMYTLQIGGNMGYTLPFGISGTCFAGIAFDTQGGIASFYGYGVGVWLGAGASMAGAIAVSNAQTVNDLGGGSANASVGLGTGGRVGLDTFVGPSDNGFVSGVGLSAGVGLGLTSYAGPTNTVISSPASSASQPSTSTQLTVPSNSGGSIILGAGVPSTSISGYPPLQTSNK
jgi:RHS repeat-associated protein